eukprot:scaffold24547_cov71-Skeletonema_dohrnii-CCMP3373.AAC.1
MSRFVDDMTVLWLGSHNDYLNFKRDVNNYGILKWTMEDPSNKAIFLDIDMTISEEGVISTITYQKLMNLYLYIPPQSAHQDGLMKGIVYGELKRYLWQNTKREDYIKMLLVASYLSLSLSGVWGVKKQAPSLSPRNPHSIDDTEYNHMLDSFYLQEEEETFQDDEYFD